MIFSLISVAERECVLWVSIHLFVCLFLKVNDVIWQDMIRTSVHTASDWLIANLGEVKGGTWMGNCTAGVTTLLVDS